MTSGLLRPQHRYAVSWNDVLKIDSITAPDRRYARRAAPPTDKMIWRERLREWGGGIVLAALILCVGGVIFAWRYWQARDASDARLLRASAVVTGKSMVSSRGRVDYGWDIQLDLNGRTTVVNTSNHVLFNRVKVGESVSIAYRIGKSGRIYVAELAELPEQHIVRTAPATR